MATYIVNVERHDTRWRLKVHAETPVMAAELAERVVCRAAEGSLDNLPDYFASSVKEDRAVYQTPATPSRLRLRDTGQPVNLTAAIKLGNAAGWDAGNRQMKREGRTR